MRLGLLLVVVLLAGCATTRPSPFTPDRCDPSGATAINHDAPRLDLFGDPLRLAQATARGLGERWLDDRPERVGEETLRWGTGDGSVTVTTVDGEVGVEVASTRSATFTASALRNLGRELGVTEEGRHSAYDATRQSWLGWHWPEHRHHGSISAVAPRSGEGYVTFRALHSLASAHVEVTDDEAVATAKAYARCALDRDGKTVAAGYTFQEASVQDWTTVFGDSFVHQVMVAFTEPVGEESHCGLSRFVAVDAVTGAVVGEPVIACD